MRTTTMTSRDAAPPHQPPLSIRILRALKPAILALLSSPLHGMLSRDVLALTWTGRRSGRRYTLPLSYVETGGSVYLCTRPEGSGWWKNVRDAGEVELVLGGRKIRAKATLVESDSEEASDGLRAFVAHNPRTGVMLYRIPRGADGKPNEDDLRREVSQSVVVRLSLL